MKLVMWEKVGGNGRGRDGLTVLDAAVHPLRPGEAHDMSSPLLHHVLEVDLCAPPATILVRLVVVPIDTLIVLGRLLPLVEVILPSSLEVVVSSRLVKVWLRCGGRPLLPPFDIAV